MRHCSEKQYADRGRRNCGYPADSAMVTHRCRRPGRVGLEGPARVRRPPRAEPSRLRPTFVLVPSAGRVMAGSSATWADRHGLHPSVISGTSWLGNSRGCPISGVPAVRGCIGPGARFSWGERASLKRSRTHLRASLDVSRAAFLDQGAQLKPALERAPGAVIRGDGSRNRGRVEVDVDDHMRQVSHGASLSARTPRSRR
jgi:hypothetical protein